MPPSRRSPLHVPDTLEEEGILVGWSLEHEYQQPPIGFHYGNEEQGPAHGFLNPVLYNREGHLMTIAPTGSGKGTGCVIPTLLRHEGPVIVIDPKGENASVTARRREELGQKVVVLDPMGICERGGDRLNPFDLVDKDSPTLVDDVAMIINILAPETISAKDRFWVSRAHQVLIGLALHLIVDHEPEYHTLEALRRSVNQDPERLQEVARKMLESEHPEVRATGRTMIVPAPETFGGIMSFAQDALSFLRGDLVQAATMDSTFSFDEITRGEPLSIYLVIPSEKLESHGPLLRVWIGAMIAAVTRRQAAPPKPTLFILDEAAQLGPLPQLRQAITLLRGYGLQTWSFWQDVSQLQRLYPMDWQTMVNNCKVLQAFGTNNMSAAAAVASMTGYPRPWEILDLDYNEMILLIGGDEAVIAQRPDYLADPLFRGMADENPRHQQDIDIMPKPRKPQRVYQRTPKDPRLPSGDPIHPPVPLWSTEERNAVGEVTAIKRLSGKELQKEVTRSLSRRRSDGWPMAMMVEGDWVDLKRHEAMLSITSIWPRLIPSFGYGLKRIEGVRHLPLSCYKDVWLCEANCFTGEGFAGYLSYLATPLSSVQLNGASAPIHQLNSMLGLDVGTEEKALTYLHFFCAAVHAQSGSFRIHESPDQIRWVGAPDAKQAEQLGGLIKPVTIEKASETEDGPAWLCDCVVQHGPNFAAAKMAIHTDGRVEMLEDSVVAEDLPIYYDRFDKGLRVLGHLIGASSSPEG